LAFIFKILSLDRFFPLFNPNSSTGGYSSTVALVAGSKYGDVLAWDTSGQPLCEFHPSDREITWLQCCRTSRSLLSSVVGEGAAGGSAAIPGFRGGRLLIGDSAGASFAWRYRPLDPRAAQTGFAPMSTPQQPKQKNSNILSGLAGLRRQDEEDQFTFEQFAQKDSVDSTPWSTPGQRVEASDSDHNSAAPKPRTRLFPSPIPVLCVFVYAVPLM
jgi:hypothetical protein